MSSAASPQGTLPGISFADACIARARNLYAGWLADKGDRGRPDGFSYLWDCCLGVLDRQRLCEWVNLELTLAEQPAAALNQVDRILLEHKLTELVEWALKLRAAADAWAGSEFHR